MQESDFFILKPQHSAPFCLLSKAVKEPPLSPPAEGTSVHKKWPSDVRFMMDAAAGLVVPDFINNTYRFLMVSPRVKAAWERKLAEKVEYLPFRIINHKGDELDDTYFVVNLLGSVDCMDAKRTEGDLNPLREDEGWYSYFWELHLDSKKLPADRKVFRLGTSPRLVLVHRSLKEEIEAAEYRGAIFVPMGGEE